MNASLTCTALDFVTASLIKLNKSRRSTADAINSSNSFDHEWAMGP
jgi:hypothetical protein